MFFADPLPAFLALGSVVLAVTGAEALYADMGHFGRNPIRVSWLVFVLPALVLNYMGQARFADPRPYAALESPFYFLAPNGSMAAAPHHCDTGSAIIASPGGDLRRLLGDAAGDPARLHARA
jgi:K+ transporter